VGKQLLRKLAGYLAGSPETMIVTVGGVPVRVEWKPVRGLRLAVDPEDGQARLSVPLGTRPATVEGFLAGRLDWINERQRAVQARQRRRQLLQGDYVSLFGEAHRLNLCIEDAPGRVVRRPGFLHLYAKPGASPDQRETILYDWYRERLKEALPPLLERWEAAIGVKTAGWGVKRMKTRWGSCNTAERRVWLNLELARLPHACLEYVLVHELVHLLERGHNARFYGLLDRFLPDWAERRAALDRDSAGQGEWDC
jgi:predicted metal-dependent hydrolase